MDVSAATTVANYLLLHRHAVADWRNPDGQLHVFELSGAGYGRAAAR